MSNTPAKRRARKISHPKKVAFLAAYSKTGNILVSAASAGIDRRTHYQWLKDDPVYASAFADAKEDAIESLEAEALRRARTGSDLLMIFLLKSLRPEKYCDKARVEHTGEGGGPIQSEAINLTIEFDELPSMMAKRVENLNGTNGSP